MNIGMLWFDNDPKAGLNMKIKRAASYYRDKYGASPTLCYVHPSMITNGNGKDKDGLVTAGLEVKTTPSVLPNHFWIGVNGVKEKAVQE
jgi:hypothetical protein